MPPVVYLPGWSLTNGLVLHPSHGTEHQPAEEGGDPDELQGQLRQHARERGIPDDDSIVVGVRWELDRSPEAAGSDLDALDAAGRELVELSDGAEGDVTGEGGNRPSCTELRAHRETVYKKTLGVIRRHEVEGSRTVVECGNIGAGSSN